MVGTWDGEALTLTEPPGEPRQSDGGGWPEQDLSTPCPTPDGGWAVVEPATATRAGLEAAIDYADGRPDLGALWLDNDAEVVEVLPDGLQQAVLDVTFTGDVVEHERELRARYGGPLCVTRAEHSRTELLDLQQRVDEALGGRMLSSSVGVRGRVDVVVAVVHQDVLDRVAEVDPEGLVDVQGWLQPVR